MNSILFLQQITSFNHFYILKCILIEFTCWCNIRLFIWLIKPLRPNGYEGFYVFKIENRLVNWLYVITYVTLFIGLIGYLRIRRMGLSLDLKPFIHDLLELFFAKEYSFIFLLANTLAASFILLTISLKYIKDFFELSLLKQYIVLHSKENENYIAYTVPPHKRGGIKSVAQEIFYWFEKTSITTLKRKFSDLGYKLKFLSDSTKYKLYRILYRIGDIIYPKYNITLIITLVIYELIFNNMVIEKLFYFLPFYFIYIIWYKASEFIWDSIPIATTIVYEIYYCSDKVKYLRMDKVEEGEGLTFLSLFIRSGLSGSYLITDVGRGGCSIALSMYWTNRYELIDKEKNIYYNRITLDIVKVKSVKKTE